MKHFTQNNISKGLEQMIRGQKKSEIVLYVVLWAILFAAAAMSVYWDGMEPSQNDALSDVSDEVSIYDWEDLLGTWKFLAKFCLVFFVHNFLIAPLLVYRNKRWLYGGCVLLLMAIFIGIMVPWNAKEPKPGRHPMGMERREMSPSKDFPDRAPRRMEECPNGGMASPPPPREEPSPKKRGAEALKGEPTPMKAKPFGGPTTVAFNIMLLLLCLNVGAKYYFKSLDDRKRMKDLERDNLNQQLQYLKYQINPHFFMNTLNNIHALVDIDSDEAKHTIEVLSKLMRYVLYDADKPMASLQKELDFLHHYIDLMRIRYTDKVRISVSLPATVPDVQVPSLLFATFVENAFKHGVSYQKDSFIEVSVRVDEMTREVDFCCNNSKKSEEGANSKITEENSGASSPKSSGNRKGGVGLQNAIKRLKLIYGSEYELKIDASREEHRLLLRLPFK